MYYLVVIISYTGLPKRLFFFCTCVDVIPDERVIKWSRGADSVIFITNNILIALKWHMNHSAYLIDNADLDNETYEEW